MKIDLKAIDFIVVSLMNKQTGIYQNILVTNRPRWKTDSMLLPEHGLICIEVFPLGKCNESVLIFHSLEEFENAINW